MVYLINYDPLEKAFQNRFYPIMNPISICITVLCLAYLIFTICCLAG